jgi:hypothetical protein
MYITRHNELQQCNNHIANKSKRTCPARLTCISNYIRGFCVYQISITSCGKGKGKFIPICAIKAYKEVEIQPHSFLTSVLDRENDHLHASAALPSNKKTLPPSYMRLGVPQSRYEHLEKRKISCLYCRSNHDFCLQIRKCRLWRARCSFVCSRPLRTLQANPLYTNWDQPVRCSTQEFDRASD